MFLGEASKSIYKYLEDNLHFKLEDTDTTRERKLTSIQLGDKEAVNYRMSL